MFQGLKVVAVVPARAGSKGLPGKNLMRIGGETLVEIAAKTALSCISIDKVILSSDSEEILNSIDIPEIVLVKRSQKSASDNAVAADVILDLLDEGVLNESLGDDYFVIWLQPTSPLRDSIHLREAFEALNREVDADGLVSVKVSPVSPQLIFVPDENGLLRPFSDSPFGVKRQEFVPSYIPNGAIYIFKISTFLRDSGFPSKRLVPYVMSHDASIDIDSENDFQDATRQWILKKHF